jgi:hypothetical protein
MKRNFTNENFEDFLRQSADGLRLRPSGKVWKNISKHLNKRRRRVGFAIGTFLLAVSTFGYFIVQDSAKKFNAFANANPVTTTSATKKVSTNEITAPGSVQKPAILNTPRHAQPFSKTSFIPVNTYPLHQLIENHPSEIKITPDANSNGNGTAIAGFTPTVVDSYSDQPAEDETKKQGSVVNDKLVTYPLTIESVINSYKAKNSKKASLQFYFTPTISYRKLSENKSFLRSQTASNPNYLPALIFDVNNMVTHKPNIGFELGTAVKYPITPKMKLRGGIQFNVNRYDIKAYNSSTTVTTIMLNGRTSNSRADSLTTYTRYSNTNTGYNTNWLQNFYVQISAPVGVEFKISGNEKTQFGVATTIQPTYVLGDRAYLISTNYKSYAEVPQLVRRWNVNTSLETFVGYSTGRLDWQVGPQVRYQLLSSFINQYPVKENLFDFGLKVGVSLNK